MDASFVVRGFTLVEMLIVLGLLGVLASVSMLLDLGAYHRILARSDTDRIMGALVQARSDAIHGVCSESSCDAPPAHGVFVGENQVVVFEGPSYEGRAQNADETYPLEGTYSISGIREIIFAAVSGEPRTTGVLSLTDQNATTWHIRIAQTGALRSNVVLSRASTTN